MFQILLKPMSRIKKLILECIKCTLSNLYQKCSESKQHRCWLPANENNKRVLDYYLRIKYLFIYEEMFKYLKYYWYLQIGWQKRQRGSKKMCGSWRVMVEGEGGGQVDLFVRSCCISRTCNNKYIEIASS